jgi:hypothetical protein
MIRDQPPVVVTLVAHWGLKSEETAQLKDFDSKAILEIKNNY